MIQESKNSIFSRFSMLFLISSLVGGFFYAFGEMDDVNIYGDSIRLPIIAMGGVAVLVLVLVTTSLVFDQLGLTDKSQALGLPEGSIRAVVSISLIVIFSILSIFLQIKISDGGKHNSIKMKEYPNIEKIIEKIPSARNISINKNEGDLDLPYILSYVDISTEASMTASNDFAKQLLIMLGTLMTSVTSFYFGAKGATGQSSPQSPPRPSPKIASVSPVTHSIKTNQKLIKLRIDGENMSSVKQVILTRNGSDSMFANKILPNEGFVTCEVAVPDSFVGDQSPWGIILIDANLQASSLPFAITITQ